MTKSKRLQATQIGRNLNWFIRNQVERQRRTFFSRKAAKHAKNGNDRGLRQAVGITKTLDQVLDIHAVPYGIVFYEAFPFFASLRLCEKIVFISGIAVDFLVASNPDTC
jgi:hypothetical protein